jgi:hypothetical protein
MKYIDKFATFDMRVQSDFQPQNLGGQTIFRYFDVTAEKQSISEESRILTYPILFLEQYSSQVRQLDFTTPKTRPRRIFRAWDFGGHLVKIWRYNFLKHGGR